MPITEYRCECGKIFEDMEHRRANIKDELECPECGKLAKRSLIPSTFGFNGDDLKRLDALIDRLSNDTFSYPDRIREQGLMTKEGLIKLKEDLI